MTGRTVPDPADLAIVDQGHALYRDVLANLTRQARELLRDSDAAQVMVDVAEAVRGEPEFDRDLLVMMVATAVVDIAAKEGR